MENVAGLSGIVAMAGVVTIGFMLMSGRAIAIWSGPRAGPSWARFFADISPFEIETAGAMVPRRSGVLLAALALAFEVAIVYFAAHPALLPAGGSEVFAIQVVVALVWTLYLLRMPRRGSSRPGGVR
jgi:hypothetical protein